MIMKEERIKFSSDYLKQSAKRVKEYQIWSSTIGLTKTPRHTKAINILIIATDKSSVNDQKSWRQLVGKLIINKLQHGFQGISAFSKKQVSTAK